MSHLSTAVIPGQYEYSFKKTGIWSSPSLIHVDPHRLPDRICDRSFLDAFRMFDSQCAVVSMPFRSQDFIIHHCGGSCS